MWLLSPCMKTYWNSVRSKISPQKPAVIFKIPSFKWAGEGIQEETLLLNILIYSCDHFGYHQFLTCLSAFTALVTLSGQHRTTLTVLIRASYMISYVGLSIRTLSYLWEWLFINYKRYESHTLQFPFKSGLQLPFMQELYLWSSLFPTTSVRQFSLTMTITMFP